MPAGDPNIYPNGAVTVFFGNATSCVKQLLDRQDYQAAKNGPSGASYALSAQSAVIFDTTAQTWPWTVNNLPSPPTIWAVNKAYTAGQSVVAPLPYGLGMNIYLCMVGGTSAAAGNGPSGAGLATDNTVKWSYVGGAYGG